MPTEKGNPDRVGARASLSSSLGGTGEGGGLQRPFSGGIYFLFGVGEWASLDKWKRMNALSRKADQELWGL